MLLLQEVQCPRIEIPAIRGVGTSFDLRHEDGGFGQAGTNAIDRHAAELAIADGGVFERGDFR